MEEKDNLKEYKNFINELYLDSVLYRAHQKKEGTIDDKDRFTLELILKKEMPDSSSGEKYIDIKYKTNNTEEIYVDKDIKLDPDENKEKELESKLIEVKNSLKKISGNTKNYKVKRIGNALTFYVDNQGIKDSFILEEAARILGLSTRKLVKSYGDNAQVILNIDDMYREGESFGMSKEDVTKALVNYYSAELSKNK
jgi:hypothetical protein